MTITVQKLMYCFLFIPLLMTFSMYGQGVRPANETGIYNGEPMKGFHGSLAIGYPMFNVFAGDNISGIGAAAFFGYDITEQFSLDAGYSLNIGVEGDLEWGAEMPFRTVHLHQFFILPGWRINKEKKISHHIYSGMGYGFGENGMPVNGWVAFPRYELGIRIGKGTVFYPFAEYILMLNQKVNSGPFLLGIGIRSYFYGV